MEYSENGEWVWTGYRWQRAPRPAPRRAMVRKPTQHGVHILLCLVTMGLWVPVYLVVCLTEWRDVGRPKYWYGDRGDRG